MLSIENLCVDIAGASILRGIAMTVGPGEIACLVGRNGAGKTPSCAPSSANSFHLPA
jgi:branched-chain amino acid transport system ATP-binding protein